jgi:hypothetical protein
MYLFHMELAKKCMFVTFTYIMKHGEGVLHYGTCRNIQWW